MDVEERVLGWGLGTFDGFLFFLLDVLSFTSGAGFRLVGLANQGIHFLSPLSEMFFEARWNTILWAFMMRWHKLQTCTAIPSSLSGLAHVGMHVSLPFLCQIKPRSEYPMSTAF
jgi:hypothetical protein